MAFSPEQKEEILVAYALCGKSARSTAKHCKDKLNINVSEDQIARWAKGLYINAESAKNADTLKQSLSDRAEALAGKLLGRVEELHSTATIMQAATTFAIMVDKMRLLREEPTSINASMRSLTPQQLEDEINAIIAAPDEDPRLKLIGD